MRALYVTVTSLPQDHSSRSSCGFCCRLGSLPAPLCLSRMAAMYLTSYRVLPAVRIAPGGRVSA
eukprot:12912041-Prorocentrum_lima.AAC.1